MMVFFFILAALAMPPPEFAFLAPEDGVWQVWISQRGEAPRLVTDDPEEKVYLSSAAETGELLAVTASGKGILLSSTGGVVDRIDFGQGVDQAALSPDGKRIVLSREEQVGGARQRDLWLLDREKQTRKPLVRRAGFQRAPAWTRDGAAVVYTVTAKGGAEDLWWVRLDGRSEKQLTVGSDRYFEPSLAPDGTVFVSSNRSGDYDIWRLDPEQVDPQPVIAEPGFDGEPNISADGSALLFVSRRSGRKEVWFAHTDGSGQRRLTEQFDGVRYPVWLQPTELPGSIAFLRVTDGLWQPWVIRPDGSGLRRLASLPTDVSRLSLSRDGATLLANCNDGSIYLVDSSDGSKHRIELDPTGSTDAVVSPDGQQVVYSVNTLGSIDSNDLWLVGIAGGRARKITHQPYLQHFPVWASGNEILYLSGHGGQVHDIWSVDAAQGTVQVVLEEHLYNFDPTASESGEIAFSSNHAGNYDIWLLEAGAREPRRLTEEPAYDGQPSLSPEAKHVVFVSRRGGVGQLWVMEIASGALRRLPVDGEVRLPFWYAGEDGEARIVAERRR